MKDDYDFSDAIKNQFPGKEKGKFTVKRDTFDYTEWRRGLWNDMKIEEIFTEASANYEKT